MPKKFKPKKESLKKFMECDFCEKYDCKAIIILKPNNFSKFASDKERNAKRVCYNCAEVLFKHRRYNFSEIWRNIFFQNLFPFDKKSKSYENYRKKYMVNHP